MFQNSLKAFFGKRSPQIEDSIIRQSDYFCDMEKMLIKIAPAYQDMESFLRELPHHFKYGGRMIHQGRNTLKAFDVNGKRIVVKQYGRPSLLNRLIYTHLRPSKARRAFEHARRLRIAGIDSPQEVAYIEITKYGMLCDSYFVSLYTEGRSFMQVIRSFPDPEAKRIMSAFVLFVAKLHHLGILHDDLNADNIRYRFTRSGYQFELIDTNRMHFVREASVRQCLTNLRRLTHEAAPYLYIVEQYAQLTGRDTNQTLLQSSILLLSFSRWTQWKNRIKKRENKSDNDSSI